MFVEQKFFVGFQHINSANKITNRALLGFLEDIGGIHSNKVGFGLIDMDKTRLTWVILNWKLKVLKRANYGENILIKTWTFAKDKIYAYRDFEVYNENEELIALATSKWVAINIDTGRIIKISEGVLEKYEPENKRVFPDYDFPKIKEEETVSSSVTYTINKQMIDMNNHVHNIYYYDLAEIAMPDEFINTDKFDDVEIMYKKEIKLGETVRCNYSNVDNTHTVSIKSEDESVLHAIVKLYKS